MNPHVARGIIFAACLMFVPSVFASPVEQSGVLAGRVVNEKGFGLQNAVVLILNAGRGGYTDQTGSFTIDSVLQGKYTVRAMIAGHGRREIANVQVSAGDTTFVAFTLDADLSRAPGDFHADSLAMFGAWRWIRSAGGLMGARATPPPSGWSRVLYLRHEGTYAFWEQDSVANYLVCSGTNTMRPCVGQIEDGPWASLCIELQGWPDELKGRELVAFLGPDTILTYPGGSGFGVADDLKHTYVRERERNEPPSGVPSRTQDRPPRMRNGIPGSYYVEAPQLVSLLWSLGAFHEWMDWQYPVSVRSVYRYSHYQIPSAVIGDFDGDGSLDVAVHGSTGNSDNKLICVLSNGGERRAIPLVSEPTASDRPPVNAGNTGSRRPGPALFLMLLHAGEKARNLDGKTVSFPNDVILVARPNGYATPYYYASGEFRTGQRIAAPHWSPWDPR